MRPPPISLFREHRQPGMVAHALNPRMLRQADLYKFEPAFCFLSPGLDSVAKLHLQSFFFL